jgi:hypothetical protein
MFLLLSLSLINGAGAVGMTCSTHCGDQKVPLGTPGRRCEDIKVDVKETRCEDVDLILLMQDRNHIGLF